MLVFVYPEKTREPLGAERWLVSWEEERPGAPDGDNFDHDRDVLNKCVAFKAYAKAKKYAEKIVADGVTFYGAATIQREVVDWYVEEDRVAEWAAAGRPEYV